MLFVRRDRFLGPVYAFSERTGEARKKAALQRAGSLLWLEDTYIALWYEGDDEVTRAIVWSLGRTLTRLRILEQRLRKCELRVAPLIRRRVVKWMCKLTRNMFQLRHHESLSVKIAARNALNRAGRASEADDEYFEQVRYAFAIPCMLEVRWMYRTLPWRQRDFQ